MSKSNQDLIKRYPNSREKSVQRAFSSLPRGPVGFSIVSGVCLQATAVDLVSVQMGAATTGLVLTAAGAATAVLCFLFSRGMERIRGYN